MRVVREHGATGGGYEEMDGNEIGLGVRTEWKELFSSRLADFDFLIHLRDPARLLGKTGRGAEGEEDIKWKGVGFDPVGMFLADLDKAFSAGVIMFFHGQGQRVVGGLWNPRALAGGEWRVKNGWSSIPVVQGDKVQGKVNQMGILAEIEALGEGIVDKIEVVKPLLET